MSTERSPYVVSEDVYQLLRKWRTDGTYTLPGESFFKDLASDLKNRLGSYFNGNVEIIEERELREGISKFAASSEYPILSIDRAYVDEDTPNIAGYIDITRLVDENFEDVDGLHPRPGSPSIETQIAGFQSGSESPVALLDDVIFTGVGIVALAQKLAFINRPVRQIITGIGIGQGIDKIKEAGIEVLCVHEYKDVIDEVCERDFLACIPMSGRTVRDQNGRYWSAPYFRPFGDPQKWASIPDEYIKDFSQFCLVRSAALWREIEKLSKGKIATDAVPRKIKALENNESVSQALSELIEI